MKKQLAYTLISIGVVLIIIKIVDSFISDKALIPYLTLTGFIFIIVGLFLLVKHKRKHLENIKKKEKSKLKRKK